MTSSPFYKIVKNKQKRINGKTYGNQRYLNIKKNQDSIIFGITNLTTQTVIDGVGGAPDRAGITRHSPYLPQLQTGVHRGSSASCGAYSFASTPRLHLEAPTSTPGLNS